MNIFSDGLACVLSSGERLMLLGVLGHEGSVRVACE